MMIRSAPTRRVRATAVVPLMAGWLSLAVAAQTLTNLSNIGDASSPPSIGFDGSSYTLRAAGSQIGGTADQFGFAWQTVMGDTEIVARLDSVQNTDSQAQAGVMIRESLAPDAPHVMLAITPGGGAKFLIRPTSGGATTTTTTSGVTAPEWVRLVRQEDDLTGYYSPDGIRWKRAGTVTLPLSTTVHVGVAVCSRRTTTAQAVFARTGFLDAGRDPSVRTWSWTGGIPQSDRYQVRLIQGGVTQACFVHITRPEDRQNLGTQGDKTIWWTHPGRTFNWASFDCWGPVTVEVRKLFGSGASRAVLSPKSYGIEPQLVDGHTIRFQLETPRHVSVKFDIAENQVSQRPEEIKHGLMIFADPPQLSAPSLTDPGVVEWDPAVNQGSAKVLYLREGKSYMGPGALKPNGTFDTNSTAGNIVLAPGQSMYLAGGSYAWFSHWQDVSDTAMGGRGIISGVKQVFKYWTPGGCCWQAFKIEDCVEGITFVDLPHHTLGHKQNAVIRHIKILAWYANQDGVRGGSGSLIENSFLKCCDDYFYAFGPFVRRCVIWPMWNGATIQLGWGGYNSSGVRMVNCDLINPEWDNLGGNQGFFDGAALEWSDRSEDHLFENIRIEGSINGLINLHTTTNADGTTPGYVRNVTFRNVTLEERQSVPSGPSRSLVRGSIVNGKVSYVRDFTFENVRIAGEWLTASNAAEHLDIDPATTTNLVFLVNAVPVDPAVAHYRFEGDLSDSTGNGNDGLPVGSPAESDGIRGSIGIRLDGIDDAVAIPRPVRTDFSIAFWVRTTDNGGSGQWWNGKGLVDGEMPGVVDDFGTALVDGRAAFGIGNPDVTLISTTPINDGRWHHVAATRESGSGAIALYVDGALEDTGTGATAPRSAPPSLRIGGLLSGAVGRFLAGDFDDVRLYSIVLSEAEVAALADLEPPSVRFQTPVDGATFLPGQPLGIAVATDDNIEVSEVQLLLNQTPIQTLTEEPWTFLHTNPPPGLHRLAAIAVDVAGNPATNEIGVSVLAQAAFGGVPRRLPGRIEAEDYDIGGSGLAWFDLTTGNAGSQYRNEDVDIESTSDTGAGYNVGWLENGEWLEYTANVAAGPHRILVRSASPRAAPGQLDLSIDGTLLGTIPIPGTGGWQTWATIEGPSFSLTGGSNQVLRLEARSGESGSRFNLNWIEFQLLPTPSPRFVGSPSLVPEGIMLGWDAVPGRVYRLQMNLKLAEGGWIEVPPPIRADGESLWVTRPVSADGSAFFRVLEESP